MSLIRTDVAWRRRDEWQRRDFLRFFLVGADHKTRWAFGAPDSPVRLAQVPTGLHGAEFEHDYQNFVGMDGGLYRGTTDKRGTITMKLWVADPRSSAWARRQHALWRESLGRGKNPARLYVVSKESGYWWIDVRPENIAEVDYMADADIPGAAGEIGEIVTFTTDRSFWTRFDEVREFTPKTGYSAQLLNLGDQEAWLRWTITGEHAGVEIGIGDDTHFLPDPRTIPTLAAFSNEELFDTPAMATLLRKIGVTSVDDLLNDPEKLALVRRYSSTIPALNYHIGGYYIDTDEAWPAMLTTAGEDLQPIFPHKFWAKPLPPRGMSRGRATTLTVRPHNPGPDFKVEVAYTPRTEQAW